LAARFFSPLKEQVVMAKKRGSAPENTTVLNVPVKFGKVSLGPEISSISVRIDRSRLNIVAADECFCGHRLTGALQLGGEDDSPGQETMYADKISGVFDVKSIGVTPKAYSITPAFASADVDFAMLFQLVGKTGRIIVRDVSELVEDEEPEAEADERDRTPIKVTGPWRDVPLKTLFKGKLHESLTDAGLKNLGKLSDYMASKKLIDIDGIGPGKAEAVAETLRHFWSDNPQFAEGDSGDVEQPEEEPAMAGAE
jgi:hypothetical protein